MTGHTVLILGGTGNSGRRIAELLLSETDVQVVLAGRNEHRAVSAAYELNDRVGSMRAKGVRVDAATPDNLRDTLRGIDLLVVASSTTDLAGQVARTALEAGCDYMDIQLSARKTETLMAMAGEIERAGRCFITDGGFHPGLPAALIRMAATHFDAMQLARVGSVIREDWRQLRFSQNTVDEFVTLMTDFEPVVLKNRGWRLSGLMGMRDTRVMDFGGTFGRKACVPMFLEELRSLPELYPSLEDTGFYVAGFNWFVDWVVMPASLIALKLWPNHGVGVMARWMAWGLRAFSRPPFGTRLRLEARGLKDGRRLALEWTVSHPDAYQLTAIPAAACLLQVLDGTIRKPGLWLQALAVEPARFVSDLERLGVEITLRETTGATVEGD